MMHMINNLGTEIELLSVIIDIASFLNLMSLYSGSWQVNEDYFALARGVLLYKCKAQS